jgi:sugar lactone lactonase YvrE
VAELFQNRLLRLVQRPANTHHLSVFYQFNGGMGPSAIALDQNGHLYVALYDFAGLHKSTTGKICEICPQGNLLKTFDVPGTEVTGITFSADYRSLYITEASSNSIFHLILDSYK